MTQQRTKKLKAWFASRKQDIILFQFAIYLVCLFVVPFWAISSGTSYEEGLVGWAIILVWTVVNWALRVGDTDV